MISGPFFSILRTATAIVVSGAFLWHIASRADTRPCQAVVHVMESDVDVRIDDWEYRVDSRRDAPLAFELPPGRHTLCMSRSGELLYKEEFTALAGENSVLTAWDAKRLERDRLQLASKNPAIGE